MKLKTNLIQFVCAGTINATFKAGGPNVTRTELSVICIPHSTFKERCARTYSLSRHVGK